MSFNHINETNVLRPCHLGERKCLFHKWVDKAWVVEPSMAVGGHNGGQKRITVGLVEWDDGTMHEAYSYEIVFDWPMHGEYLFREDLEGETK